MSKKRRTRVFSKIDELPEDIREEVHKMLYSPLVTYLDISMTLREKGYEISKSAVGRYALRQNAVAQKLMEAQEQTRALVSAIKQNPDTDYTEATMQMLMSELTKKVATAQEEFDNMPMDKAGRLIVAISRTKVYKDRVRADLMKKIDLAFQKFRERIPQVIKNDPDLSKRMEELLEEAKALVLDDE